MLLIILTTTSVNNQVLPIIISVLSLIVAILTYILSRSSKKNAERTANEASERALNAELLAQGGLELSLTESISSSKQRVIEASITWNNFKNANKNQPDDLYRKAFYAALEDNLNAYERVCSLYLDSKLDKKRFEKDFTTEIRRLVEEGTHRDRYFNPPNTSPYKAILKVYDMWFNLEK